MENAGSFKVSYRMFPKNADLPHRQTSATFAGSYKSIKNDNVPADMAEHIICSDKRYHLHDAGRPSV